MKAFESVLPQMLDDLLAGIQLIESSQLKAGGSGGFGVESGDGFHQTRYRKGVANATLTADEMETSTLTGQGDRKLDESGNARAIDLGNVIEVDDNLARPSLDQVLREFVQMLTGFADSQAPMDL
jgi:hypothetical protein